MVSILSVAGYVMRANGGCQTPCLVISACAVAETALASTPPLSCRCYVGRCGGSRLVLHTLSAVPPTVTRFFEDEVRARSTTGAQ